MNHFFLYDIPVSFNPDQNMVRQRFLELSKKYQPPLIEHYGDAVPGEIPLKLLQVNEAYRIFKSRDETIRYVLQLNGIITDEGYELPSAFLEQVAQINDVLTAAKIDNDHERIRAVKAEVARIEANIYTPVKNVLERYNVDDITTTELLQVREYYYHKKYLDRILAGMV